MYDILRGPVYANRNNNAQVQIRKKIERKIVIIFFSISFNMCFGCPKDPSHRDGYFEYPQHMF